MATRCLTQIKSVQEQIAALNGRARSTRTELQNETIQIKSYVVPDRTKVKNELTDVLGRPRDSTETDIERASTSDVSCTMPSMNDASDERTITFTRTAPAGTKIEDEQVSTYSSMPPPGIEHKEALISTKSCTSPGDTGNEDSPDSEEDRVSNGCLANDVVESKLVCEEVPACEFWMGYGMNTACSHARPWTNSDPTQHIAFNIQIRISDPQGAMDPPLDLSTIKYFARSTLTWKSGSIRLDLDGIPLTWDDERDDILFRTLGRLNSFEKLTVKLNLQEDGRLTSCHPKEGYVQVQKVLEPLLGPSEYKDGEWSDRCIEFHPRAFVSI